MVDCLILLRFGGNCFLDPPEEEEDTLLEGDIDECDPCFLRIVEDVDPAVIGFGGGRGTGTVRTFPLC